MTPRIENEARIDVLADDPRTGDFVWSTNEEEFRNNDFGDVLDELECDGELEVGRTVYYGTRVEKEAAYFMPGAEHVLDSAADAAYDFGGEWAEDFGRDVTKEAKQQLNAFLAEWANKHLTVTFYRLEKVKAYALTAEDVASVQGSAA